MYLNLDRFWNRSAYYSGVGSSLAGSNELIDKQIFDSISETNEESEIIRWKTNAARVLERAKTKHGR